MTFDLRAHPDQHLSQVGNLGLLGGVFQDGLAFGQRGSHQEVLGTGDRHHVGGDARALQPGAPRRQRGDHVAVLDRDLGPHGLQALDVLVHRSGADRAAARQGHPGLAEARQERPQRQHGGPHGLDQLVRRFGPDGAGGLQGHAPALAVGLGLHAHVVQKATHRRHVLQAWHVGQRHRLRRQQGGAQLGQGRVLGAGNQHVTAQLAASADDQFVHSESVAAATQRGKAAHSAGV